MQVDFTLEELKRILLLSDTQIPSECIPKDEKVDAAIYDKVCTMVLVINQDK
jgi:hypothetical protein